MEPNSREFYKQCAFQKFCNTVLHNEACDAHRELHRHKAREVTFSDLPLDEARQLHTFDEYFKRETAETVFEKAGFVTIRPIHQHFPPDIFLISQKSLSACTVSCFSTC